MNWPLIRLEEICSIGSGGTPSRAKLAEYYGGTIPWVKSGELRENLITNTEEQITELGLEESSAKLLPSGTLLVALYGATVGRLGVLGVQAATNQAVCYLIPRDEKQVDRNYLFRAMQAQVPAWLNARVGGAQPNISQSVIKSTKIPLPPLSEQRRIATILDKADAIRRKRRRAIDLMNDFLRSVFLEMFGDPISNPLKWPEVKLADLLAVPPRIGTIEPANDGGNLIVIRVGELGGINPELARSKKVSLSAAEQERFKVNVGDILLARAIGSEEQLGKSSIFEDNRDDVVFDSHVMRLRFKSNLILPLFFLHLFKTDQGKARVLRRGGRTAVQFNINASQLSDVTIPLPPLSLQSKFVTICRNQSNMLRKAELAEAATNQLFASLSASYLEQ